MMSDNNGTKCQLQTVDGTVLRRDSYQQRFQTVEFSFLPEHPLGLYPGFRFHVACDHRFLIMSSLHCNIPIEPRQVRLLSVMR